jgi:hypothetical protein
MFRCLTPCPAGQHVPDKIATFSAAWPELGVERALQCVAIGFIEGGLVSIISHDAASASFI